MELPKRYDPKESEPKWQKFWDENKIYKFDSKDTKREIFSIDTPPPTVSGKMHMGHAFGNSQQDFIARYKRMSGFNVLQPFGTDDNGLPTQTLIQKTKRVRATDMPRKDFVQLCLDTLENELRPVYLQDWKRLGISCDFEVAYTTINKHSQKISQWSFIDLYNKKRAYRKNAPIMICPKCQTAIAQVELEDMQKQSFMNYIKAKLETGEFLIYGTTRPELIPGCVGMSMHEDGEYVRVKKDNEIWLLSKEAAEKFKEEWNLSEPISTFKGKELSGVGVKIPLTEETIKITHDEITKTEFGTGFVYYCTYGGVDCIEWMERHPGVKSKSIMNFSGRYNENAGKYQGMKSEQAREEVLNDLEAIGSLIKKEPISHVVNAHERCGHEVEYVEETQWFIKVLDLKEKWLELGNKLNWFPGHMKNRYDNWAKGLKWDWNISRQISFGVPFPVWYCANCQEPIMARKDDLPVDPTEDKSPVDKCPICRSTEIIPENDIINTWATSSLTPSIVKELFKDKPVYDSLISKPMNLRPQGHDIISFWLFNTVVKSHLHYEMKPWNDCFINGWILDPKGKKMSKSKGNIIEPQVIVDKYSADALRFMAATPKLGEDLPFPEKDVLTGQKFINKLWNASKFSIMHLEDYQNKELSNEEKSEITETFDKWLLSKLHTLIKEATESFDKYEYSKAKAGTEKFFWQVFCDQYLEIVKDRLYNPDTRGVEARRSGQASLYQTILSVLKLIAPIMPHITEEIYQLYFKNIESHQSVHLSNWPQYNSNLVDEKIELTGDLGIDIIGSVRKYKSDNQLSLKEDLSKLILVSGDEHFKEMIGSIKDDLKSVLRVKEIIFEGETSMESEKFNVKIGIEK
jgi:valyl-tRNA synthetase